MKRVVTVVIIVAVLAGAGYWWTRQSSRTSTTNTNSSQSSSQSKGQPAAEASATATITYTDTGFDPKAVTIKSGGTLTVVNKSSASIQFDSNPHPEHTDDPELNLGLVAAGQSGTLKPTKTGSFGVHNHFKPSTQAIIVVK